MQRVLIILGMHRSGTSSLAGIIQKAGVHFPNVSNYNRYNLKGNKENRWIMKLHDDLLHYNNGSWDNPPAKVEWPIKFKREMDEIIKEAGNALIWGFKDPRTLLTLDGWLEKIQHPSLVASFRHPAAVVQSLSERNHFNPEKSLELWRIYNTKLLDYHKIYHFPVISFDLAKTDYEKKIKQLAEILKIDINQQALDFYDHNLRHHQDTQNLNLPQPVLKIYEKLTRIAR